MVGWFCSWVCLNAIQLEPEGQPWNVMQCNCKGKQSFLFYFNSYINFSGPMFHK